MGMEYKEIDINDNIKKYEFRTSEYFRNKIPNKYYINSEDELNDFFDLFSNKISIKKEDLKDNSIFIQIETVGSGSIKIKLTSVTFENNNINFNIEIKRPPMGTCDMASWYLVAIIPNHQLNNINMNGWYKPSEIKKKNKPIKKLNSIK